MYACEHGCVMALELKLNKQDANTSLTLRCVFLKYLQAKDGAKTVSYFAASIHISTSN